jgi:hypothetical protein
MAVIDIGPGAINRSGTWSFKTEDSTIVDLGNPANDTGILDTFEIFANTTLSDVKIGTFSGSDTSYDDRDYEIIGTVTASSKQTFTGKNCNVSSGDYLGIFATDGAIERATSGGASVYYKVGDYFGSGSNTYTLVADDVISIYATGATAAAGNPYYYYLQQ